VVGWVGNCEVPGDDEVIVAAEQGMASVLGEWGSKSGRVFT